MRRNSLFGLGLAAVCAVVLAIVLGAAWHLVDASVGIDIPTEDCHLHGRVMMEMMLGLKMLVYK